MKSSTKRIKSLLAEADSEELTPRIKISNKISDKHKRAHTLEVPGDHPGPSYSKASETHCYPPALCPEIKTSQEYFPFADNTQERAHSPELQVPADDCHSLPFTLTLILLHWILGSKLLSKVFILLTTVNIYTLQSSPMTFLELLDYHTVLVLIRILLHCTLLRLHLVLCHPLVTNHLDNPHLYPHH